MTRAEYYEQVKKKLEQTDFGNPESIKEFNRYVRGLRREIEQEAKEIVKN